MRKKGKFQPGESGNPSGRPIGSTNRINAKAKDKLAEFYTKTMLPSLKDDWPKLTPYQRVKYVADFSSFFIEKLRANYVEADLNLSELQQAEILAELIIKYVDKHEVRFGETNE